MSVIAKAAEAFGKYLKGLDRAALNCDPIKLLGIVIDKVR